MASKNIQINYFNGNSYDILVPQTNIQITNGSYTGNGQSSVTLNFTFRPKLFTLTGNGGNSWCTICLSTSGNVGYGNIMFNLNFDGYIVYVENSLTVNYSYIGTFRTSSKKISNITNGKVTIATDSQYFFNLSNTAYYYYIIG